MIANEFLDVQFDGGRQTLEARLRHENSTAGIRHWSLFHGTKRAALKVIADEGNDTRMASQGMAACLCSDAAYCDAQRG